MTKTIITTDSGCNPQNIVNMIPCIVIDENNINYYDTKKVNDDDINIITGENVFNKAITGEKLHTSSPNISDYIEVMTPYLKDDYNIIHLSMSNGISSGSVNASNIAANLLNKEYGSNRVNVIDTLTAGSGGTVIYEYANDLVKKNKPTSEIIKELEVIKHNIISSYFISKVEGFVKSGRAPKEAILSDKLQLRYRIDVSTNGKLFPKGMFRGKINTCFMKHLKKIINEKNIEEYNPNYLSLLITRLKEINIEEAKEYINSFKYFNNKIVKELNFYSAIASYGVEDQVGIGLIKKLEKNFK